MIEANSVSYTYPGAAGPALDRISFHVDRGEIFGFLGPSGAGKSTTQKVLIGLLRDYQGTISVMGRDLGSWRNDYYERVGVSFELPNHYLKLTARENLACFRALYSGPTEEPEALLEMLGLAEDANKRVGEFSKGMRVRLNFARSLLNRPDLLFLDEPTAGLDPGTGRMVRDIIRRKRDEGATIFLSTHNMTAADELCDRVAFIVDGRIELVDRPRTLKLSHGKRTLRVEYLADGRVMHRDFALDGLADETRFLDLLRSETIQTMHTQETTLEDVFLEVTGRRLE